MLTIPEVAARFSVDPSLVTKWCKDGTLPNATKNKGRWAIPESDVEGYTAARSEKVCNKCDKPFTPKDPKTRYCSVKCRKLGELKRRYARKRAAGLCAHCMKAPSADGYVMCDECRAKNSHRNKNLRSDQRERMHEWRRNWMEDKPDYYRETAQRAHNKLRTEVFGHYGGQCACCGEADPMFLTIDHINNDGAAHRREIGQSLSGGINFYRWLRRNNYPEGFQPLCYNCNCGKARNGGICPHRTK